MLTSKDITLVTIDDIITFYELNKGESSTHEYKRELKLDSNESKREFLADVSSFANSKGGVIIYGIDEIEGLKGIELVDEDKTILQIEEIIRSNLTPRIQYSLKVFSWGVNKKILLIKIAASYVKPILVNFSGSQRFWSRGEKGKYRLDYDQIKANFISSELGKNQIIEFLQERTSNIISENTPYKLNAGPKIIFHTIPIHFFLNNMTYDMVAFERKFTNIRLMDANGSYQKTFNFDGILAYHSNGHSGQSYLQLFRNGTIESVSNSIFESTLEKTIPSTIFMNCFIDALLNHLDITFDLVGYYYPVIMSLTIFGVSEYSLATERARVGINVSKNNLLKFPHIYINEKPTSLAADLKVWFDSLWQTFGFENCYHYDSNGELPYKYGILK